MGCCNYYVAIACNYTHSQKVAVPNVGRENIECFGHCALRSCITLDNAAARHIDHNHRDDVHTHRHTFMRTSIELHVIALHYATLHYITLHHITLHHISLHDTTLHYITLRCITLHYITLHYVTLHYLTLPYIPLHYITLPHPTLPCHTYIHASMYAVAHMICMM